MRTRPPARPAIFEPLDRRVLMHGGGVDGGFGAVEFGAPEFDLPVIRLAGYVERQGPAPAAATTRPLSAVPVLESRPGARATLFLDFDGSAAERWGDFDVPATPAYDSDGDAGSFTDAELDDVRRVFARVSEAYAPFDLNVTTVDPGAYADRRAARIVFGGDGAWLGGTSGGVAYVGGFANRAPNTGYAFTKNLGNASPKPSADAASHEAGHLFGLDHQASYDGARRTAEYDAGNGSAAPVMGVSYYSERALWRVGPTPESSATIQDDLAVLAGSANGFGYAADDVGDAPAAATPMDAAGGAVSAAGVIGRAGDADAFSFSTLAGSVTFAVSPVTGSMLDASARLLDAAGVEVASASTASLGETLTATVAAGTYYLQVFGAGGYGDLGRYAVAGTVTTDPDAVTPPADLTATGQGGRVALRWADRSGNEVGFRAERSGDGGATWSTAGDAAAGVTGLVDNEVDPATDYLYRVFARGAARDSDFSGSAAVRVSPATPAGVSASAVDAGRVRVSWADGAGEAAYGIDRSADGGASWAEVARTAADATTFTASGLAADAPYGFRVRSVGPGGESSAGAEAGARTYLPAPSGVRATPFGQTRIDVRWADLRGEAGYVVERLVGSSWRAAGSVGANRTALSITGLMPGESLRLRLRSVNATGVGPAGPEASAVTVPATPALSVSHRPDGRVQLKWSNVAGETRYRVESSDDGRRWSALATTGPGRIDATAYAPSPGAARLWRVRAENGSGASPWSAPARLVANAPSAPSNLRAARQSAGRVRLTWWNVRGETGYRVDRSADDGRTWAAAGAVGRDVGAFVDARVTAGRSYRWRVVALSPAGESTPSATARATA